MIDLASVRDRISTYRAAVTVAVLLVGVGIAWIAAGPVPADFALLYTTLVLFLAATAVDAVRAHPLYDLGSRVVVAFLFAFSALVVEDGNAVLLGLAALAVLDVGVAAYNYRHGTSYLRLEWADADRPE